MADVWVGYRDSGAYSDWDRVILGVWASRAAAEAALAAWHAAHPQAHERSWNADDDDPLPLDSPGRQLRAWTEPPEGADPEDRMPWPEPTELWRAQPLSDDHLVFDQMEYYIARWPVQGIAPAPGATDG